MTTTLVSPMQCQQCSNARDIVGLYHFDMFFDYLESDKQDIANIESN